MKFVEVLNDRFAKELEKQLPDSSMDRMRVMVAHHKALAQALASTAPAGVLT